MKLTHLREICAAAFVLCTVLSGAAEARSLPPHWVGSWATSQQIVEPENALAPDDLRDATLRQIVHLSIGGATLRVHLSNAFGAAPLHIIGAYEQIIARAHANGIRTIGATILPFGGFAYYHPIADNEAPRHPGQPDHMLPAYDSEDHIHPSPAGYRLMADAIPLSLFMHRRVRPARKALGAGGKFH